MSSWWRAMRPRSRSNGPSKLSRWTANPSTCSVASGGSAGWTRDRSAVTAHAIG
jgi:hypothetical protein